MVTTVTNFGVLIRYAHDLAKAIESGDHDRIEIAQRKHDEYRDLCLRSDQMNIRPIDL